MIDTVDEATLELIKENTTITRNKPLADVVRPKPKPKGYGR